MPLTTTANVTSTAREALQESGLLLGEHAKETPFGGNPEVEGLASPGVALAEAPCENSHRAVALQASLFENQARLHEKYCAMDDRSQARLGTWVHGTDCRFSRS